MKTIAQLLSEQNQRRLIPAGYEQMTLSDGVRSLPVPSEGADMALVKVEGSGIRYRDDGVDPTASVGWPVDVGETLTYDASMGDIRVVGRSAGAVLNVAFYRAQD